MACSIWAGRRNGSTAGWLRGSASLALSCLPVALLSRTARTRVLPLYLHAVGLRQPAHTRHLYAVKSEAEFERDLDYLVRRYQPLTLDEYAGHVLGHRLVARPSILLTVDDGLSEVANVLAPILLRKGVPAVLFVCSDFTENRKLAYDHTVSLVLDRIDQACLSRNNRAEVQRLLGLDEPTIQNVRSLLLGFRWQARALLDELALVLGVDIQGYLRSEHPYLTVDELLALQRDGFVIGAHSVDHPRYSSLALTEQLRQTVESAGWVRSNFRSSVVAFAFPYGDTAVASGFFSDLRKSKAVDLTFSTDGLIDTGIPGVLGRMSLETPKWGARRLVGWHLARRIGKSAYTRPF